MTAPPEIPAPEPPPQGAPDRRTWHERARWFAAEFTVVVSGVLVALALNAWWSGCQDAGQERIYLRQLLSDLSATERRISASDSAMRSADRAGALLVRSYQTPESPPADSLVAWVRAASRYRYPDPVTGTAEALVSTGDLTLIRDDGLRASIVSYLQESRLLAGDFRTDASAWERARDDLFRTIDYQDVLAATVPRPVRDSLARSFPDFPLPAGERRQRFPFDANAFLSDREPYDALVRMNNAKTNMRWDREALERATRALGARVEAAL